MTEQVATQEIAVRAEQGQRLDGKQLAYIANTDFVPKQYRGNVPAIMACVQTGRELGLGDLEALRSIYVVDGKPTLSAELMVKLARRAGHSIGGEFGDGLVKVTGRRADTGDEMSVTWTLDMAQRAGLVAKDNWKKYPEAMLWARAATQLCRMLFPDVLSGVSYAPEEAEMSPEERVADSLVAAVPMPADDGPDDTSDDTPDEVLTPTADDVTDPPSAGSSSSTFRAPRGPRGGVK